jgi:TPR repeat protein
MSDRTPSDPGRDADSAAASGLWNDGGAGPAEESEEEAERLRLGVRAYRQGKYGEALPLLLACGQAGSREAQRMLSRIYYAGQGVPADLERYLYWLARAAESGDPAARAKLKRRHAAGDIPASLLEDPFVRTLVRRGP